MELLVNTKEPVSWRQRTSIPRLLGGFGLNRSNNFGSFERSPLEILKEAIFRGSISIGNNKMIIAVQLQQTASRFDSLAAEKWMNRHFDCASESSERVANLLTDLTDCQNEHVIAISDWGIGEGDANQ